MDTDASRGWDRTAVLREKKGKKIFNDFMLFAQREKRKNVINHFIKKQLRRAKNLNFTVNGDEFSGADLPLITYYYHGEKLLRIKNRREIRDKFSSKNFLRYYPNIFILLNS